MDHQSPEARIALVLGITGAIGGALAEALHRRGFRIRALTRRGSRPSLAYPVDWVTGDAERSSDVIAASAKAAVIVHAVNPPGYTKWREKAIPMLASTIEAAARAGATILFPANVYVFNDRSPDIVNEQTPLSPTTRKGRVRMDMEAMLRIAAAQRGVRVIAIRAGDYFGPQVPGSWFARAVVSQGWSTKIVRALPQQGVGHSWAYVPDLAEAFARCVEVGPALEAYEMLHFAGHYDLPGQSLAETARECLGADRVKVKPFSWLPLYLGAPVSPLLREVVEMMWLWRHPLRLDNTRLVRLIGPEPHTPLRDAIAATLGPRPKSLPSAYPRSSSAARGAK